ncbi:hypothetical protein BS47DRAFT_1367020 [Hydnum rufescens UP504]|uniref:Uncharacterized protein n=1 Tax=Hydnum rufescens UP504 TaxID=1448309 RepID=A0A9P6DQ22_9AGAM|nr:hypothetical protein BS47DRAFT_1367020 [Hydnum rufescens UP504]
MPNKDAPNEDATYSNTPNGNMTTSNGYPRYHIRRGGCGTCIRSTTQTARKITYEPKGMGPVQDRVPHPTAAGVGNTPWQCASNATYGTASNGDAAHSNAPTKAGITHLPRQVSMSPANEYGTKPHNPLINTRTMGTRMNRHTYEPEYTAPAHAVNFLQNAVTYCRKLH